MRLTLHSLLLLLFSLTLTAQDTATGIQFTDGSFDELLTQARAEDKLIFIDAYTTWCGPCKMMSAKIFPDERVGDVYNERFINAKIDMEKGEGPGLASRYAVSAYPTYLFVNGDGELVHKGLGYIPKSAFLDLADAAVSDKSIGALSDRYTAGERGGAFIKEYAEVLVATREGQRAERVVGDYLDGQDDWSTPENLELLIGSPGQLGDKRMRYLVEHAAAVEKTVGASRLMNTLQQGIVSAYLQQNGKRSLVAPEHMSDFYAEHAAPLQERLLKHYSLIFYERSGDMESYLPLALDYYRAHPSDDFTELNSIAWTFFENAEDEAQLAQAVEWAERSVAISANYPNLDTLAWLYHKTGQQKKAESTAKRAIDLAKEAGVDYSDTEKILEQ